MLPGKEGLEVLKSVRRAGVATPVMFLTAKDTVNDRVDGLEAGADDYLVKPFSNREFLARVRALTRRSLVLQNEELEYRNIRLLVEKGICLVDAEQVALTRTETQLLELFIRNRNQVLKREQILDRIWGFDRAVENANVEPELIMMGEVSRLTQLFTILLDNSVKYMGRAGTISITAYRESQKIQVLFEDNGIGIPAEETGNVFRRFYRLDKARTQNNGGSGLGLAIAQWIVEAHNGKIALKSDNDRGMHYRITFYLASSR